MKRIFLGNLDAALSETCIRSLLERHGTVEGVKGITHGDTGRPRGGPLMKGVLEYGYPFANHI